MPSKENPNIGRVLILYLLFPNSSGFSEAQNEKRWQEKPWQEKVIETTVTE